MPCDYCDKPLTKGTLLHSTLQHPQRPQFLYRYRWRKFFIAVFFDNQFRYFSIRFLHIECLILRKYYRKIRTFIFLMISFISSSVALSINSAPRSCQSRLFTWSDSTTPLTFFASILTSNGYPFCLVVIGQNSANLDFCCKPEAKAQLRGVFHAVHVLSAA